MYSENGWFSPGSILYSTGGVRRSSRLTAPSESDANTISAGAKALRIISAGFIVSSVSVTASGALEGLGKGLPSLVISVFRYAVIIIPVAFILSRIYEVNGVWWSFGVTELVTAFISYIIYKKATHHH